MADFEIRALAGDVLTNISDYSRLAPYIWVEGLKSSLETKYSIEHPPQLLKTGLSFPKINAGRRPKDALENSNLQWHWKMPSYNESHLLIDSNKGDHNSRRKSRAFDNFEQSINKEASKTTGLKSVQARLADRQRRLVESQNSKKEKWSLSSNGASRESMLPEADEDEY